jgi:hypothetical protein
MPALNPALPRGATRKCGAWTTRHGSGDRQKDSLENPPQVDANSRPPMKLPFLLPALGLGLATQTVFAAEARSVVSLDGEWRIAEGGLDKPPAEFAHRVPVPGLVDMAKPAFAEVGRKSEKRQAFWYRREFTLKRPVPEVALLKIHKARYGTKVWLNGKVVGEHLPCFTPAWLDVKKTLQGGDQMNELIIRVGADRDSMPQDMPTGWDFEKYLFIPGIYDSVELILTGAPYIVNVQTVPDIEKEAVRVVAEVASGEKACEFELQAAVSLRGSTRVDGAWTTSKNSLRARKTRTMDFTVPIRDPRLWSPEEPFLYDLTLSTGADATRTRFGMRSFGFVRAKKRAVLNGKPYYMRGSNVTLYRFFEDSARGDLPWDREWVRRLHQKIKTMHWNSLRYCIGFPPEFWYDIADEEGILIQDEFPIWLLGGSKNQCPEWPVAEKIIPQYTGWMRERWNHPCVVIWDAQNESGTPETGKALTAVRQLDLSNRPWENGWMEPQAPTDCVESHPYMHIRGWWPKGKPFKMSEIAGMDGKPKLNKAQQSLDLPIIINEYGWLWLTRDGEPTCLTTNVYRHAIGEKSTVQQRREFYARALAAKTEFWRAHRECACVLHFCALGYSRPGDKPRPEGGATSDHWLDVKQLKFEPLFEIYVKDAFAPTGLMLDFWAEEVPAAEKRDVDVVVINDLYNPLHGDVRFRVLRGTKVLAEQTKPCAVAVLGDRRLAFPFTAPEAAGHYTLEATLMTRKAPPVSSLRDFKVP